MRKGRSQRKSRDPGAPLSRKPLQASAGGPQLVIGLTGPESANETRETRGSEIAGDVTGKASIELRQLRELDDRPVPVTTQIGIPQLRPEPPAPPEPPRELTEAERRELAREKSLEIVRETLEVVRESLASQAPDAMPATEAAATATNTWVDQLKPPSVDEDEQTDPNPNDLSESTMMSAVNVLPAVATAAPAASAREATIPPPPDTDPDLARRAADELEAESLAAQVLPPPDEQSLAPVVTGVVAAEPVAEEFFSQGELPASGTDDDDDWDYVKNKAKRKSLPHVVERRARFAKYVRWAVTGAAVVCLAAVGASVIPRRGATANAPAKAAAAVEAPVAKAATAPQVTPEVAAPASTTFNFGVTPAKLASPTANEPTAPPKADAPKAPAAEPAAAAEPGTATPPVLGTKTAEEEKKDSRKALERHKLAEAIEAGERSVALDPTDGEAWLLLGAAYQDKGKMVDARRAYKACVTEGKRGPLNECRKMAR